VAKIAHMNREELGGRKALLPSALETLNQRERHVLIERRLRDNPTTLEELSRQYGISRERGAAGRDARLREAAKGNEGADRCGALTTILSEVLSYPSPQ
jgi:hypothetical protein